MIEYEEQIVDNTCQQLVINPQQFDVMVCYGSNYLDNTGVDQYLNNLIYMEKSNNLNCPGYA